MLSTCVLSSYVSSNNLLRIQIRIQFRLVYRLLSNFYSPNGQIAARARALFFSLFINIKTGESFIYNGRLTVKIAREWCFVTFRVGFSRNVRHLRTPVMGEHQFIQVHWLRCNCTHWISMDECNQCNEWTRNRPETLMSIAILTTCLLIDLPSF